MSFKENIEQLEIGFLASVTSVLAILDNNKQVLLKQKTQYDTNYNNTSPKTISEKEEWIDAHFYFNEYEPLLIQSLFISQYSLFESHLCSLSKTIEQLDRNTVKIKDLKGNGIVNRYRKYLYLICTIESANHENNFWDDFRKFQFIRNRIVHNESYLNNDGLNFQTLPAYLLLKKYDKSKISTDGQFRIFNEKFIEDFGSLIINISIYLTKEIKEKYS